MGLVLLKEPLVMGFSRPSLIDLNMDGVITTLQSGVALLEYAASGSAPPFVMELHTLYRAHSNSYTDITLRLCFVVLTSKEVSPLLAAI